MRLPVTTKLLIGFLAISLLVVLVGAFSYRITQEIVYSFRGSEEYFRSVVTEATEAAIQIKEAESQLMLYVILGDEDRRFAAGERLKFIDVPLLNDGVKESSESFLRILLTNPVGGAVLGHTDCDGDRSGQ